MTTGGTESVSSGGATLQGSYSGATGAISEVGFYYGTTSGNLGNKVVATGTSSPFSKSISGLSSNTTYYYKAYVIEGGEERLGDVTSFRTKAIATASVTTSAASSVGQTSTTLNGSYAEATGTVSRVGFKYGTSSGNLDQDTYTNGNSTPFSKSLTGLTAGTTYYFKAYVVEYNENSGSTEYRYGTERSFTTLSDTPQPTWSSYLSDYGMPDVSGLGVSLRQTGSNDRDDNWYGINTSNNKRQIAIHTYSSGAPNDEETLNYVVLYDGNKYAPVWTYHVMNTTYWEDNNVGRTKPDPWTTDPAISLTQQTGLDNASTVGYSRGHLVASNYRQTTTNQNKQTFYYSNQAPQWQNSFNDGMWSSLETRVKNQSPSGTTMLYVITGVLYEGNITTLPSGNKDVPIPSHFYKCIMKCTFNGSGEISGAQGIAFVYTNEAHNGNYYDNAFVTTIDAIETRAGFDFFANVPTSYQNSAESNTNHTWFTGQN